ncbi:winged helix-turn-helix domain-containing protein [Chelativorans sp. YIM 93263]|uniref:winged helix-turn-helix domain-containing protein n=1 Tax=Chelativorans sp. YIM 93263 TaxID=2906648 RepID=UPI002379E09E|nr:winged helix family transcriptional regulator [Chelativorans sp. YIM 93263]
MSFQIKHCSMSLDRALLLFAPESDRTLENVVLSLHSEGKLCVASVSEGGRDIVGRATKVGKPVRRGHLAFDAHFTTAVDEQGETIRFSRSERKLLFLFSQRAGHVLPRDVLLDAVSGHGSDVNDRNIDHLVNRLRRKLGDSAHDPKFIATQYGEGYIWIADSGAANGDPAGPIILGPLTGLSKCKRFRKAGERFTGRIRQRLQEELRSVTTPIFGAADLASPRKLKHADGAFRLELAFLEIDNRLDCAVTLKRSESEDVVAITRIEVERSPEKNTAVADRLVTDIVARIWDLVGIKASALEAPTALPTAVRMHEAAQVVGTVPEYSWKDNEDRLRAVLNERPNDAEARLMLAIALHTKYVLSGIEIFSSSDPREEDIAEMEELVCGALPGIQENGVHALTAAKLLWFVNPAHRPLAMKIGKRAFETTPAFGAACSLYGQLQMWNGDIEQALLLYDKALGFTQPETHFHLYLLVLICQAHTAAGNPEALGWALKGLCDRGPQNRRLFPLLFQPPPSLDVSGDLEAMLAGMNCQQAYAGLRQVHFICARLFLHPQKQCNILQRPFNLLTDCFGDACVPREVAATMSIPRPLSRTARGRIEPDWSGSVEHR